MIAVGRWRISRIALLWIGLAVTTWIMAQIGADLAKALDARWVMKLPRSLQISMKGEISAAMAWLVESAHFGLFSFKELTRGISWLIAQPYDLARGLLVNGVTVGRGNDAIQVFPPLSWIAVIATVSAMGWYARSWKLSLFVGLCFLYLAAFGQWDSAMITLASILIAVPFGVLGGLLVGIGAYRWRWVDRITAPILDLMQTVPVFAYLVPILFLFGFGPVSALVATVIYAMPPMVRVTTHALRGVPGEILEFGRMAGCTDRQMMTRILLPSALPGLMVGVNQVIMLSLNMVIIASMIGAGGLGYDVLTSLRRLDIGGGIEAGVAIVVLAIALDRLSQALPSRLAQPDSPSGSGFVRRHPWLILSGIVILATGLIGLLVPAVQSYPDAARITTGAVWADMVRWINVTFFDQLEAAKTFMLLTFMIPVKRFLLALPWPWVILLLTLAGWQLGRWRLALLCLLLCLFILLNGLWEDAMVTLYLCGVSVVIACLIGIPIGVLSAQNERANRVVQGFIDTLQTLPSFVYLIPVVMLFRVGDFSAMIAVILYALAPAVRYAAHGVRSINPHLLEAGVVSGCTPRQLLTRIKLPLAMPDILLGVNQTIMLALSMLVITALVGTRDLGQEVYVALTKADTGRGIVAGIAVACIAIIADRLIAAGAAQARRRLGLA